MWRRKFINLEFHQTLNCRDFTIILTLTFTYLWAESQEAAFLTAVYKVVFQVNYQHCGLQATCKKTKYKYYTLCS